MIKKTILVLICCVSFAFALENNKIKVSTSVQDRAKLNLNNQISQKLRDAYNYINWFKVNYSEDRGLRILKITNLDHIELESNNMLFKIKVLDIQKLYQADLYISMIADSQPTNASYNKIINEAKYYKKQVNLFIISEEMLFITKKINDIWYQKEKSGEIPSDFINNYASHYKKTALGKRAYKEAFTEASTINKDIDLKLKIITTANQLRWFTSKYTITGLFVVNTAKNLNNLSWTANNTKYTISLKDAKFGKQLIKSIQQISNSITNNIELNQAIKAMQVYERYLMADLKKSLSKVKIQTEKMQVTPLEKLAATKRFGVVFIYKSSCPYCHQQAPILAEISKRYNLDVYPISYDNKPINPFIKYLKFTPDMNKYFGNQGLYFPKIIIQDLESKNLLFWDVSTGFEDRNRLINDLNIVANNILTNSGHQPKSLNNTSKEQNYA